MREVAFEMKSRLESIVTSPDFRRLLLQRDDEGLVVDLLRESVFQVEPEKRLIHGIRVDTPAEILANKLCTLLSRSEVRDLVDVRALEAAGYSIDQALAAAGKKDSGFTVAQLAWVLGEIKLGEDLIPPGETSRVELQLYLEKLLTRLTRTAFPST